MSGGPAGGGMSGGGTGLISGGGLSIGSDGRGNSDDGCSSIRGQVATTLPTLVFGYTPMSSFHRSGCARMKLAMRLMQVASWRTSTDTPRDRRSGSSPANV
jgi:hypothetical protein